MAKLLFVVHRYAPYPGGSEYYVQNMAEEALSRGHDVTVLSHTHKRDLNGVKVTSDYNILTGFWDLIIVHGADVVSQNIVHVNSESIPSPILYMIIKPSESQIALYGMKNATYLGCSTIEDYDHCEKFGYESKRVFINHGIPIEKTIYPKTWKSETVNFVSVGGFWPHKGMVELAETFIKVNSKFENTWLHLYGYGPGPEIPLHPRIHVNKQASQESVLQAIANASVYIMNSTEEGFGLVLLEAMANKTPWFARRIAGAKLLGRYGYTYTNQQELTDLMEAYIKYQDYLCDTKDVNWLDKDVDVAYKYVCDNHSIKNTVDDIEALL